MAIKRWVTYAGVSLFLIGLTSFDASRTVQASPEWDARWFYFNGCPRNNSPVGSGHTPCFGNSTSWGQQSGHWVSYAYVNCQDPGLQYAEFYELQDSVWVQVTEEYWEEGECAP